MLMTAIMTTMLRACALDLAKMATILVHVLTLSMSSCHSRELLVLFGSFLVSVASSAALFLETAYISNCM